MTIVIDYLILEMLGTWVFCYVSRLCPALHDLIDNSIEGIQILNGLSPNVPSVVIVENWLVRCNSLLEQMDKIRKDIGNILTAEKDFIHALIIYGVLMWPSLVGSVLEPLLDSASLTAAPPAWVTIFKLREQKNPLPLELDYPQQIIINVIVTLKDTQKYW